MRIAAIDHRTGEFLDAAALAKRDREPRRSGPMVISDGLDGVLNPADGRRYDSKRAYYRAVRAAGAEIVGNETQKQTPPPPPPVRPDIIAAMKRHGAL